MSTEARARIDSHRLMQKAVDPVHEARINSVRENIEAQKKKEAKRWKKRAVVHAVAFVFSFVLAFGVAVLGVLLVSDPELVLTQVIIALLFSLVFIGSFTTFRMLVLHTLMEEYPNKEEDPGVHHHLAKSIAYGFVGLVLAIVLVGLIMNIASAEVL